MRAEDCTPGLAVVYRPYPGGPPEDGEVVRRVENAAGDLVMVAYRNGPQAGKRCGTYPRDLEPAHPARPDSGADS